MSRLLRCLPFCLLAALCHAPLARAEAPFNFDATPGKLPKDVVPTYYDLRLTPDIEARTFSGEETITVDFKKADRQCVLNASDLAITSAQLSSSDGDLIKPTVTLDAEAQTCTLTFPAEVPAGQYQLALQFTGKINSDGGGLFASTYPGRTANPKPCSARRWSRPTPGACSLAGRTLLPREVPCHRAERPVRDDGCVQYAARADPRDSESRFQPELEFRDHPPDG